VVGLHADRADGLHAAEVEEGVIQGVDLRLGGSGGAVEDGAGGEGAGEKGLPGAGEFGRGEDGLGVVRRIVAGGDAEGEVGELLPVALGGDAVHRLRAVGVDVNQARDDGAAAAVDHRGGGGDGRPVGRADGPDAVGLDDDDAVLDHLIAAHGDDAGAGQGDDAV